MLRRLAHPAIAALALGGLTLVPAAAQARVFFGFGFGPYYAPFYRPYYAPYFYRPFAYYYPPVPVPYGYRPPVAYPAPTAYEGGRGPACNAGSYVCPLKLPLRPGTPCSCPANNGGRAYGQSS